MGRLLQLDAGGIQAYLYGTNVLRESIGASELVWAATELWPGAILSSLRLSPGDILLYAGGGNALLLFPGAPDAKRFTASYSRKLLMEAPGLRVTAASVEYDLQRDSLKAKLEELAELLAARKRQAPPPLPLLGLGVTAACQSSGLPAVEYVRDPGGSLRMVSADVRAKRATVDRANERLNQLLPASEPGRPHFAFPLDFDQLGRSHGDTSYLSVVHADGNSSGQFFRRLDQKFPEIRQNDDLLRARRQLSGLYREAGEAAVKRLVAEVAGACTLEQGRWGIGKGENRITLVRDGCGEATRSRQSKTAKKEERWFLPFRPLVFGGDDLTFVCDGRLGLALARRFLDLLYEEAQRCLQARSELTNCLGDLRADLGRACAGIATVRVHYPFSRAYALAEELLASAKQCAREAANGGADGYGAAIDWHIASSGLRNGLEAIRTAESTTNHGSLVMRPLLAEAQFGHWRTLPNFDTLVTKFRQLAGRQRSKMKRLQELLREGPGHVANFLEAFQITLPELQEMPNDKYRTTGWIGDVCVWHDAIEAAELYLDLPLAAAESAAAPGPAAEQEAAHA